MQRREHALNALKGRIPGIGGKYISNLGLIGASQKADDVFVPAPKHDLKIDPDCRLLPFDANDSTVIDFYSVPQGPNAVTLKLQNVLVNADDNLTMPAITENLSDVDKARFISLRGKGASGFYNRCDYGEFGFTNADWILGRRFRFGLHPVPDDGVCVCECSKDLTAAIADRFHDEAEHPIACYKFSAAWIRRHDAIVRVVSKACHEGAIPTTVEPRPLSLTDRKRPDTTHQFTGSDVRADVTVIHPAAKSYAAEAAHAPGHAANIAAHRKTLKHGPKTKQDGATFVPLAIETYGRLHPKVIDFFKLVAKETVDAGLCTEPAGAFPTPKIQAGRLLNKTLARVSAALLKGNAQILRQFARSARKSSKSSA